MYILFAILIFGFLIFIHELGHFLTAKALDVQVNEFSICMGPAIVKKQKGETLYSLRCIPVGGYCAMEGEDEESDNPQSVHVQGLVETADHSGGRLVYEFPDGPCRAGAHLFLRRGLLNGQNLRLL